MKTICFLSLILAATYAHAENYKLDLAHTELGFSVKHLLISNVKGRFDKFAGTFEYDKSSHAIKNLVVEIDPSTINTNQKDRDDHLRSDEFFDVKKYKTITFKADRSEFQVDGNSAKVSGVLRIKEKDQPVVLNVTLNGETEIEGVQKIAFSASTEINRKNWGINWNKNLDKGGVAVSEEVKIMIEGEANLIATKNKTQSKTK